MNKVILTGNLTRDIEVSTLPKGSLVGTFTIANNRGFGDNQRTSFIRCNLFGDKRIEGLEQYLVQGVKVLVEGELDITSKEFEDGYQNFTSVFVENIEILKFKDIEEEDNKQKSKTGTKNRKYGKK